MFNDSGHCSLNLNAGNVQGTQYSDGKKDMMIGMAITYNEKPSCEKCF